MSKDNAGNIGWLIVGFFLLIIPWITNQASTATIKSLISILGLIIVTAALIKNE